MSGVQAYSSKSAPIVTLDSSVLEQEAARPESLSRLAPTPIEEPLEAAFKRALSPRFWGALPVCAAAALALLVSSVIFPFMSENHDEPVYLLQAEALRAGSFTVPAPPEDATAFRPWLTALQDGRYVFKYTPVHAAFLALGRTLFGSYRASLALIAAGLTSAVLLLSTELLKNRKAALTATWAFTLSPLVLVFNSTFLSYSSSLMLLATFAALLFRGMNRKSPRTLAFSGLALGLAFFARPLDAIVFSIPLVLYLFFSARKGKRLPNLASFVAGAAGPVILAAAYNLKLMGNPFQFPFSVVDRLDRLGFGVRRMVPGHRSFDYNLGSALTGFGQQAFWLQIFTFGGPFLTGLFVLYVVRRKPRGPERALAWIAVSLPTAYFFFWGAYYIGLGWASNFGPFYWMPILVPITILATKAWFGLLERRPGRARSLALAMVILTTAGTARVAVANYQGATIDRDVYETVESRAPQRNNSLVMLPSFAGQWVMHPFALFRNDLHLRGKTIYAVNRGSKNVQLALRHSDRDVYQLRLIGKPGPSRQVRLLRSDVVSAPTFEVSMDIVNPTDRRYVAVQVIRGSLIQWAVIDTSSSKGRSYRIDFALSADGARDLAWKAGKFRKKDYPLAIAAYFSDTPDFRSRKAVEQRFWHRVNDKGELQLLNPPEVFVGSGTSRALRWKLVEEHPALDLEVTPQRP